MKNCEKTSDLVGEFVRYQQTGRDFASAWEGIEPIVKEFAARHLGRMGLAPSRRRRARVGREDGRDPGGADESAIHDVVNDTAVVLMKLAGADAKGRFDCGKATPGISGLRGWLWRVVGSQAANWVRDNRGRRGLTVKSESSLEQRYRFDRDEPGSLFDRLAAKPEGQDVLPILEACIVRIPDTFHRQILLRKLHDDLSLRQTARAMNVTTSRVQRQLARALAVLKHLVECHGIDETHLGA